MNEFFSYSDNDIMISFSHDEIPDPLDFSMHTHEFYELYYIINGRGTFRVEGNAYPLENGDILIMRPAEAHYIDIDPLFPYTRMVLNFSRSIFESFDEEDYLFLPYHNHEGGQFNRYRSLDFENQIYRTFLNNIITKSDNIRIQTVTNLFALLNEISKAFLHKKSSFDNDSLPNRIANYINRNLKENITLESLCSSFFISKPQLCRIFKEATGSTVWEYITVKRLVEANRLLNAGIPPTRVFSECGFNDYSVFYRAYKKKYGISPAFTFRG